MARKDGDFKVKAESWYSRCRWLEEQWEVEGHKVIRVSNIRHKIRQNRQEHYENRVQSISKPG